MNSLSDENATKTPPANSCYVSSYSLPEEIEYARLNKATNYVLFISAENQQGISRSNPRNLKASFGAKVSSTKLIKDLHFTRANEILCTTTDSHTAKEIVTIDSLMDKPVKVRLNYDTITTRFLLFNIPTDIPLWEITEEIEDSNDLKIKEIRRFNKKGSKDNFTNIALVTVYGNALPERVFVYLESTRINLFVDKPKLYNICGSYNHSSKKCRSQTARCFTCGETHGIEDCTENELKCLNCQGPHHTNYNLCPAYLEEVAILTYKAENYLSYSTARRQFKERNAQAKYSTAIKRGMNSNSQMNNMHQAEPPINKKELQTIIIETVQPLFQSFMSQFQEMMLQFVKPMISFSQLEEPMSTEATGLPVQPTISSHKTDQTKKIPDTNKKTVNPSTSIDNTALKKAKLELCQQILEISQKQNTKNSTNGTPGGSSTVHGT